MSDGAWWAGWIAGAALGSSVVAGFALGISVTLKARVERVEEKQRQLAAVVIVRVAGGAGIGMESAPEPGP